MIYGSSSLSIILVNSLTERLHISDKTVLDWHKVCEEEENGTGNVQKLSSERETCNYGSETLRYLIGSFSPRTVWGGEIWILKKALSEAPISRNCWYDVSLP